MQIEFGNYRINSIHEKDAWPLCDFSVVNTDRLKDYFPEIVKGNLNPTLSKFFVAEKIKSFERGEEYLFTIKKIEERVIIGLLYIEDIEADKGQAELSYCVGYQFEGKGIISRATRLISHWAFENIGVNTMRLLIHKENIASQKVAERNQFVWKKTLPKEYKLHNGELADMELFELKRDESCQNP